MTLQSLSYIGFVLKARSGVFFRSRKLSRPSMGGGYVQGGIADRSGSCVGICSCLNQWSYQPSMTMCGCVVESRPLVPVIARLGRGAFAQQKFQDLQVTLEGSKVERRPTVLVGLEIVISWKFKKRDGSGGVAEHDRRLQQLS